MVGWKVPVRCACSRVGGDVGGDTWQVYSRVGGAVGGGTWQVYSRVGGWSYLAGVLVRCGPAPL